MSDILQLKKDAGILDLKKVAPSLTRLKGMLNWDPHPVHGASLSQGFDLDLFVFSLNKGGKIDGGQDVCFYHNKSIHNGAVQIPVDNRTGEGDDDEYVLFDLQKAPVDRSFDLYVFVYEAAERGHNFGMIANPTVHLVDEVTNATIQVYSLNQHVTGTAVHLGRVSNDGNGWAFSPIGDAAAADPNAVARAYM